MPTDHRPTAPAGPTTRLSPAELAQLPPPGAPRAPQPPASRSPEPSATHRPYELKRTFGQITWFLAVVLAVVMVGALVSGRGFTFGLWGDGPKIQVEQTEAVGAGGGVAREQLESAQGDLAAEAAEANDAVLDRPEAVVETAIDIDGLWTSALGLNYSIEQVGSAATITETDAFGNITAVGQGTIEGSTFRFSYTTAAFTTGTGELTLSFDGSQLDGSFSDTFGRRPVTLS